MGNHKGIKIKALISLDRTTLTEIGGLPDLGAAQFYGATSKHFGILQQYNGVDVNFDLYGRNFGYMFADVPTSGKIKKVEVRLNGDLGLVVSGLNLDALKAVREWQKDDPFATFAKLLIGDDTIFGSPFDDPDLWGGKGDDRLWGDYGIDVVNGFKGTDLNDGGPGNDQLIDVKGHDMFQFSSPFMQGGANYAYNFDTIKKFGKGDALYFDRDLFAAAGSKVSKGELYFGDAAHDGNDYFLWDQGSRTFFYDPDGNGPAEATPIFQTLNDAKITHKAIVMGYVDYGP